jgi:hypothetical protein
MVFLQSVSFLFLVAAIFFLAVMRVGAFVIHPRPEEREAVDKIVVSLIFLWTIIFCISLFWRA